MDVNSPAEILTGLVFFAVCGGAVVVATPLTVSEATALAAENPLIATGIGLFVVLVSLFGSASGRPYQP